MVRVCVEVREGDELRKVTVCADCISQAVGKATDRFPGLAVRVVFPIDGEEFFGGRETEAAGTEGLDAPRLLAGRVT
jgi:hypothetical protein